MLDYHIDLAHNAVVTRAAGRVTIGDLTNHLFRLMRDPNFKPELNALVVAENVNAVPSPTEVGTLTPLIRAWSKRRAGVKWAFVLPNRATLDFAESALGDLRLTAVTARCFISETTARAWLGPKPTADAKRTNPAAAATQESVEPDSGAELRMARFGSPG